MPITDATQRFSSRVENYIRYRPGYPPGVIETLKSECGLTADSVIADVGSGTGLLARIFLENGNRVIGIEPNTDMREAGDRLLKDFAKFSSLDGTAETTTLADGSVDFVTAGQAAHWFDRGRAKVEFGRILRPYGWVALIWNDRSTDATPLLVEYEQLLVTYGTDYHEVKRDGIETVIQMKEFFAPNPLVTRIFPNSQEFDLDGLKGRLLSSSYAPAEGHANHAPMMAELQRIFDAYQENGTVRFEYETRMYYGQIAPSH